MQTAIRNTVDIGTIIMLVNDVINIEPVGKIISPYIKNPLQIQSFTQFLNKANEFYDEIGIIQRTTAERSFIKKNDLISNYNNMEVVKYMSEDIFKTEVGNMGTFVIKVKYRQHSTWQGEVEWIEKKETKMFRSTMELVKMIDEALEASSENTK